MALLKIRDGGRTVARVKSACCACLWLALALLSTRGVAAPVETPPPEYQVKAVFLFNFAQFVQWPARAFRDAQSPLVVGVLGSDPFGNYLDQITSGEKIDGRSINVRRFRRIEDVTACQILFISRSESAQLDKILSSLSGRSILTVGDAENFARRGGMIGFAMENGKIRLRVNVDAAKSVDLTISSKLLRPATIVTKERD